MSVKKFTSLESRASLSARGSLNRFDSATYVGISTRLLDQLASDGEIPRIKIGRKTLFRVVDLDEYLASKIEGLKSDPRLTADQSSPEGADA